MLAATAPHLRRSGYCHDSLRYWRLFGPQFHGSRIPCIASNEHTCALLSGGSMNRTVLIGFMALAAAVAATSAAPAHAASGEAPLCEQLRVSIDLAKKQQALLSVEGSGMRDADRATQSRDIAERVNWSNRLMQQAKCTSVPPAPFPEGQSEYRTQALNCRADESQGVQEPASCVLADWRPARQ
jgi:hypothetical protein